MAANPVRRLDKNHDPIFGHGLQDICTGSEAAEQKLRCRLLSVNLDWFLDLTHGLPWWAPDSSDLKPFLGAEPRDPGYVQATIKAYILATTGIAKINDFSFVVVPNTRESFLNTDVESDDGDPIQLIDAGP